MWIKLIRCTPVSFHPNDMRPDILCWKDAPRGIFSIHSVWNSIHLLQKKSGVIGACMT